MREKMMTATDERALRNTLDNLGSEVPPKAAISAPTGTILGLLRIALGSIFAWGFLDKLFGLGFDTCRTQEGTIDAFCSSAMIRGGSPTWGFLNFGTGGSKTSGLVTWLASSAPDSIGFGDLLYMLALLVTGMTFLTGIALRLGALTGTLLMASIYLASKVWPEFHPFMSEHIVYVLAMIALAALGAGRWLGVGKGLSERLGARSALLT